MTGRLTCKKPSHLRSETFILQISHLMAEPLRFKTLFLKKEREFISILNKSKDIDAKDLSWKPSQFLVTLELRCTLFLPHQQNLNRTYLDINYSYK